MNSKTVKQSFNKGLLTSTLTETQREEVRQLLSNCLAADEKKAKESQLQVEITNKDNTTEVVKMSSALNKIAYSKLKKLYKELTPSEKKTVDEVAKQLASDEGLTVGHRVFKVKK